MPDIGEYITGNFLTPEQIKELKEKTAEIMEDGVLNEDTPFGREILEIPVKLSDGKEKVFGMNKTSAKNLSEKWGDKTANWKGKKIRFELLKQNVRGAMKDVIYAYPEEAEEIVV